MAAKAASSRSRDSASVEKTEKTGRTTNGPSNASIKRSKPKKAGKKLSKRRQYAARQNEIC